MANLAELFEALASLLWPVLAIFFVWYAREPISSVVRSWAWRESTFKVAGLEISVDNYNQQERDLIADLQDKIISLEDQIHNLPEVQKKVTEEIIQQNEPSIKLVLWVDDHPENHAQLIEQLNNKEISVAQEKTTDEAISRLATSKFDLVISDMHRIEFRKAHHEAGIELIKAIREHELAMPIIVFFGRNKNAAKIYKKVAIEAGATLVTSSPTELMSAIEFPNKVLQLT